MSRIYKTARGKTLDMDKVKLANESSIAVGNMKVNARGDLIGVAGQIAAGRNQIMDKVYAVDPAPYSPNDPAVYAQKQAMMESSRGKALNDLANNLVIPTAPAEPTADEPGPEAGVRGSLASSLAKTTSIVQEPLPKPTKKPNGPTRL
jgi:hypothetical protein